MNYSELNGERQHAGRLRDAAYWAADVALVAVLAVFLVLFFCQRVTVTGHSMEPALNASDVVLVDQVRYHFREPQRYDIVVFEKENNSALKRYVKRLIGLPGETVQIIDEKVYIDGVPLKAEEYQHVALAGLAEEPVTLRENEYFVLGDNRDSSEDSRFSNIGNVQRQEIEGCIWFRLSPFQNLGFVGGGEALDETADETADRADHETTHGISGGASD